MKIIIINNSEKKLLKIQKKKKKKNQVKSTGPSDVSPGPGSQLMDPSRCLLRTIETHVQERNTHTHTHTHIIPLGDGWCNFLLSFLPTDSTEQDPRHWLNGSDWLASSSSSLSAPQEAASFVCLCDNHRGYAYNHVLLCLLTQSFPAFEPGKNGNNHDNAHWKLLSSLSQAPCMQTNGHLNPQPNN